MVLAEKRPGNTELSLSTCPGFFSQILSSQTACFRYDKHNIGLFFFTRLYTRSSMFGLKQDIDFLRLVCNRISISYLWSETGYRFLTF